MTALDTLIISRKKDRETATGDWLEETMKSDPWYKDIMPNVN